MKLTASAVEQLRNLLDQPEPKLIKVGVRNRGCSGLAYHLEYVDKPGAFDETVEQDGVRVLIDSKALFSIIGSEMDWAEDKLSQRFVFRNPNISKLSRPLPSWDVTCTNQAQRRNADAANRSWYRNAIEIINCIFYRQIHDTYDVQGQVLSAMPSLVLRQLEFAVGDDSSRRGIIEWRN